MLALDGKQRFFEGIGKSVDTKFFSLVGLAAVGLVFSGCSGSSESTPVNLSVGVPGAPAAVTPGTGGGIPATVGVDPTLPGPAAENPGSNPTTPGVGPTTPGVGPTTPGVNPTAPALSTQSTPPLMQRLQRRHYVNSLAYLMDPYGIPTEGINHPFDGLELGYGVGTRIDSDLTTTYRDNAETLSAALMDKLNEDPTLAGCPSITDGCASEFTQRFAEYAYRRPLSEEQKGRVEAIRALGADDWVTGIGYAVAFILQSPAFLYYVDLKDEVGDYTLASRLSYLLWDEPPSATTLQLAAEGRLSDPAIFDAHVSDMLADPRTDAALMHFVRQWFALDDVTGIAKDTQVFDGFGQEVRQAMLSDALAFVETSLLQPRSLDALLTGETLLTSELTAALQAFGDNVAPMRQGLLGQPAVLAMLAGPQERSPIQRGTFVINELLCLELHTPDGLDIGAAQTELEEIKQNLSLRESIDRLTSSPDCAGCHNLINALGYGFDNYNAVGLPIDENLPASVSLPGTSELTFNGVEELQTQLVTTSLLSACAAEQAMRYTNTIPRPSDAQSFVIEGAVSASSDLRELFGNIARTLVNRESGTN